MNLVLRAKKIVLSPGSEWPVIAAESDTVQDVFVRYVLPLAAIGPIAGWVGRSVFGVAVPFLGTYRVPLAAGLTGAVAGFVMAIVGCFVVGLIIDALAPKFAGEKNMVQAMKCSVYSYTPGWIAGILFLIPVLAPIVLVAALYGLYLLYLGLPELMKSPKEQAAGYTAVVVIAAIAVFIVLAIAGRIIGLATMGVPGAGLGVLPSSSMQRGIPTEMAPATDSVLGKLDSLGKALDASGKKMDEANRKGDTNAAVGAAMESLATIASGGRKVEPIPTDTLKAMLPAALDGMTRSDVATKETSFGPMSVTTVGAVYDAGGRRVELAVGDMAAAGGLIALTALVGAGQVTDTPTRYERMQRVDGRLVIESKDKSTGAAEYGVVVGERFVVNARAPNSDPQALKALVDQVDLGKLEAMKNVGVQK